MKMQRFGDDLWIDADAILLVERYERAVVPGYVFSERDIYVTVRLTDGTSRTVLASSDAGYALTAYCNGLVADNG